MTTEGRILCICNDNTDRGELFVACDCCNNWSHVRCYYKGDPKSVRLPNAFYCNNCMSGGNVCEKCTKVCKTAEELAAHLKTHPVLAPELSDAQMLLLTSELFDGID
jgi:hypothetical protein